MELLFAGLGGALLGFIFHFSMPGQDTRGAFWAAAWGICSAVVVWEVFIWLGLKSGGGWIWVFALVASGLTVIASIRLTTGRRRAADAELLEALFRGQAA